MRTVPRSGLRTLLGVLAVVLATAAAARGADQPQWGARFSRNMVSGEKGLPDGFDPATGRNVKWTALLGNETHATPIVAGGRVFVGTNNGRPRDPRHEGDYGVLMCFDEQDGRFLWQLIMPKLGLDPYWDWPSAGIVGPPTVEGDRVYLVTNRGEVACLDIRGQADGNQGPFTDEGRHMARRDAAPLDVTPLDADLLWLFDIIQETGIRQHDSAHASILLDGPFLYVNTSNGVDNTHRRIRSPDAPSLIVLEKATGRLVAQDAERIGPRIFHSTWSSPALGEVGGRRLVFFAGGDGVCYAFEALPHDLPPGPVRPLKKVWWFDCDPTAPKENVHEFISNRRQSPSNIKSMPVLHDGRLYVTVGGDIWWGKRQSWLQCIDPAGTGDATATNLVWSYPMESHCVTTPAVAGGLVFVGDCARTVHCVDARSGSLYWTHETKGEMWASPLVADGKVYVASRRGEFTVLAADKEKRVLSTVDLGAPISSTPTAANGVLYVATYSHLYAVQAAGR